MDEELNIGFVPWGSLGAGFLTGKMSANDPTRTSARLERDFEGARKAFWTEDEFGPAELTPEYTFY